MADLSSSTPSVPPPPSAATLSQTPVPSDQPPLVPPSPSPRGRTLRARPSDPGPATSSSSSARITPNGRSGRTSGRVLSQDEVEKAKAKLGAESVRTRREDLVKRKEQELKGLIDDHDTAIREQFHLERFVSLIDGWDPVALKHDNSPVFTQWREAKHNLFNLVEPNPGAPVAGPSRPRSSLPSRTTRRQALEQSEAYAYLAPQTNGHGSVGAPPNDMPSTLRKGKSKAESVAAESPLFTSLREAARHANDMPPPVEPSSKAKSSKARRATLALSDAPPSEDDSTSPAPSNDTGKKRGRTSLPNLPPAKKSRSSIVAAESSASPSPALAYSPAASPAPEPSPAPPLPSLAHLPFPPPPHRPRERRVGRSAIVYTDPNQKPPTLPKFGGDLDPILNSYIQLEETGPLPDLRALELRAAREAYLRNRVNYLQHQGRLLRLLDEEEDELAPTGQSKSAANSSKKPIVTGPPRQTDFHDSLMAHMAQVRNAMVGEAKYKPQACKRIARMIQQHWEHELGKDERERQALLRDQKRRARDLARAVKKRWGLAVKIIRARKVAAQKLEQDRLGKEHLQNFLQRSTGLLEAQREDIVGREEEGSDGSQVSAAEEDEDVEEDEAEGQVEGEAGEEDVEDDEEADDEDADNDEDDEGSDDAASVDLRALLGDSPDDTIDMDVDGEAAPSSALEVSDIATDAVAPDLAETHVSSPLGLAVIDAKSLPSLVDEAVAEKPVTVAIGDSLENGVPTADEHSSVPITVPEIVEIKSDTTPPAQPRHRSSRIRKPKPVNLVDTVDPDAEDAEFDEAPSDLDEQDALLDVEMEDAEDEAGEEDDSEDAGLLADADVPIEELLQRYGYPAPGEAAAEQSNFADQAVKTRTADQSLTDAALEDAHSPALIVEGKRQRRVRAIWTPEDDLPQHAKGRPKIEEVESTPEFTTDDDDDEEEEEELSVADDDDGPKIRPPFLLRGTLRPYQHAGLEWLASLYANNMNGILADEMGLGKTIQTISLLAHLACDRGVWGQHLIIVPTSVILNWEMEFKKFLPGMKVLTYYGNQKERKEKRIGWHTENAWQVCITSYQIVLADQHIFRRKNWVYMILDEAHNIKNFRSQRWQTLLGFKAQRRLLLTGTPLQNNLMELWSLLYFLMPNGVTADATAVVGFANHKEFTEWFSNPMDKAVESGDVMDEEMLATVSKLHTLLRPFILRRLKSEVETQLPGKFEHVVYCRLSKRQRFLYDEFMSRTSTREALTSGGYLGVVNTLMQLRKVCNHPDLFEVRPVRTSFAMERSVAADFEPTEILVRKRLLEWHDNDARWNWGLRDIGDAGLLITAHEGESGWAAASRGRLDASDKLPYVERVINKTPPPADTRTIEGWMRYRTYLEKQATIARWKSTSQANRLRCQQGPIYGSTTLALLSDLPRRLLPLDVDRRKTDLIGEHEPPAASLVYSIDDRARQMAPLIDHYAVVPPKALARDMPTFALPGLAPTSHPSLTNLDFDQTLHPVTVKLQIAFPDASLLQYDCGKLQKLDEMLRDLKANGHRVLIFTQMTRVLDILEMFLSYNGHRYLRLDGSTKIEDRQVITERFNSDSRIFCFIASSRSGGVGINLTGADTVFFYDSDWNPSMDRQCMDRAHRIGQTREVHIYRFVSMHTVEENMLKKANQKRLLDRVVIQEGDFTTEFFGKMDWRDMLDDDMKALAAEGDGEGHSRDAPGGRIEDVDVEGTPVAVDTETVAPRLGQERAFAHALAQVEDEEDAAAARVAQGEGEMDFAEFGVETDPANKQRVQQQAVRGKAARRSFNPESSGTPMAGTSDIDVDAIGNGEEEDEVEGEDGEYDEDEDEDGPGAVDEYMLNWVEVDWDWFNSY